MLDKVLLAYLVADGLFVLAGGLLLGVVFMTKNDWNNPSVDNVAATLLLMQTPVNAALVNAGLVFFTFIMSMPGLFLISKRFWLKIHSWLVLACATVTLVLGLVIWFLTLETRTNMGVIWARQTPSMQQLLQQKFNCCGYMDIPFHQDATCPSVFLAAKKPNCVGPFSNFANGFLDLVFTTMFGIVALDAIMFLCTVMLLKRRSEQERWRHIDAKLRYSRI